jgi:hypothetical protein
VPLLVVVWAVVASAQAVSTQQQQDQQFSHCMEGAVAACPVLPASTTATGGIAAAAAGATLSDAAGLDLGLQGPAAAIAATAASAFEAVCGRALTHLGDLAAGEGCVVDRKCAGCYNHTTQPSPVHAFILLLTCLRSAGCDTT